MSGTRELYRRAVHRALLVISAAARKAADTPRVRGAHHRSIRWIVILALQGSTFAADHDLTGVVKRADVLNMLAGLLGPNFKGMSDRETAAFLVRDGDSLRCFAWPVSTRFRAQHYKGAIPRGTIGVVHTHPDDAPFPSSQDIAEARRIGIGIIVLTRRRITMADSDGVVVELVHDGGWTRRQHRPCP